jgi:hypothetical protein
MDPIKEKQLEKRKELLSDIPEKPQRQDSTSAQLLDLLAVAQRLGMYDAADFLRNQIQN